MATLTELDGEGGMCGVCVCVCVSGGLLDRKELWPGWPPFRT